MKKANITLPKYWQRDRSVKSIRIHGKTWFDKVNGNTYCSARVVVNEGLKNEFGFRMPFTYGYGDYYAQMSIEALVSAGAISKDNYWDFRHNAITSCDEHCLQREVKAWGKED